MPSATGRDARADFSETETETEAVVRPCRWSTDHLRSLYALVHQARSDVWRKHQQIEARTVTSSICVCLGRGQGSGTLFVVSRRCWRRRSEGLIDQLSSGSVGAGCVAGDESIQQHSA